MSGNWARRQLDSWANLTLSDNFGSSENFPIPSKSPDLYIDCNIASLWGNIDKPEKQRRCISLSDDVTHVRTQGQVPRVPPGAVVSLRTALWQNQWFKKSMQTVPYSLHPKKPWKINKCSLTDCSFDWRQQQRLWSKIWSSIQVILPWSQSSYRRGNQGFVFKVGSSNDSQSLLGYSFLIFT